MPGTFRPRDLAAARVARPLAFARRWSRWRSLSRRCFCSALEQPAPASRVPSPRVPVPSSYAPGEIVVKLADSTTPTAGAAIARAAGAVDPTPIAGHTRLLRPAPGVKIDTALARVRRRSATSCGRCPTSSRARRASSSLTTRAPAARPGAGRGAVELLRRIRRRGPRSMGQRCGRRRAWRTWCDRCGARHRRRVREPRPVSPLARFLALHVRARATTSSRATPYPNDRNGHGTFVAATIAEETNNLYGLTGLAYGARIMPVRVLDSQGEGEASTIAEGVRFAVTTARA